MTIVGLVLLVGGALLVVGAFVTRAGHPFTQTLRLSAAGVVLLLFGFELVGHG